MSKFVGTATDESFKIAVQGLDIPLLEKRDLLHTIRKMPGEYSDIGERLLIVSYQHKRYYAS